jgi:hypothetical protein
MHGSQNNRSILTRKVSALICSRFCLALVSRVEVEVEVEGTVKPVITRMRSGAKKIWGLPLNREQGERAEISEVITQFV